MWIERTFSTVAPGGDSTTHHSASSRTRRIGTVWARRTARRLLAAQLPRRWAHIRGVGHRAEQVAQVLPPADRPVLVTAAWLHDIGYATQLDTGFHPLDGARFLAHSSVPPRVCALIAHHSGAAAVAELLGLAEQLAQFAEERGRCATPSGIAI
jgi:putative nucleotidyltransferase with HDIG domain